MSRCRRARCVGRLSLPVPDDDDDDARRDSTTMMMRNNQSVIGIPTALLTVLHVDSSTLYAREDLAADRKRPAG